MVHVRNQRCAAHAEQQRKRYNGIPKDERDAYMKRLMINTGAAIAKGEIRI